MIYLFEYYLRYGFSSTNNKIYSFILWYKYLRNAADEHKIKLQLTKFIVSARATQLIRCKRIII